MTGILVNISAVILVLWAFAYVGRRIYLSVRYKRCCGCTHGSDGRGCCAGCRSGDCGKCKDYVKKNGN